MMPLCSCPPVLLSSCPPVLLSSCPPVLLSSCPPVLLSSCPPVLLSSCPPVLLSSCPPVLLSSCPPVLLSSCPPVLLMRSSAESAPHAPEMAAEDQLRWRMLALIALAELLGMSVWFAANAVAPQLAERWALSRERRGG